MAAVIELPPISTSENKENVNEDLILHCNKIAMDYLGAGNLKVCHMLLKKVENLLLGKSNTFGSYAKKKLLAITLNNIGCYYKKKNKPNVSLYYLLKALMLEEENGVSDENNISGTLLNICAILSELRKHEDAICYARRALDVLNAAIEKLTMSISHHKDGSMRNRVKDLLTESNDSEDYNDFMQASYDQTYSNKSSVLSPSLKTNTTFIEENLNKKESLYPTLAIAYHNYAVEQEFLKDCEGSLKTYKKSFEIAKMHLGVTNSVTLSILRSYENAEKKFMEERKLKKDRKHMRDTSQRYSSKADFSEIENTFSHSSSKKFYPSKQAYYASKESAKKKDKLHAQVTMSHSMNRRQISLDKDNFFAGKNCSTLPTKKFFGGGYFEQNHIKSNRFNLFHRMLESAIQKKKNRSVNQSLRIDKMEERESSKESLKKDLLNKSKVDNYDDYHTVATSKPLFKKSRISPQPKAASRSTTRGTKRNGYNSGASSKNRNHYATPKRSRAGVDENDYYVVTRPRENDIKRVGIRRSEESNKDDSKLNKSSLTYNQNYGNSKHQVNASFQGHHLIGDNIKNVEHIEHIRNLKRMRNMMHGIERNKKNMNEEGKNVEEKNESRENSESMNKEAMKKRESFHSHTHSENNYNSRGLNQSLVRNSNNRKERFKINRSDRVSSDGGAKYIAAASASGKRSLSKISKQFNNMKSTLQDYESIIQNSQVQKKEPLQDTQ